MQVLKAERDDDVDAKRSDLFKLQGEFLLKFVSAIWKRVISCHINTKKWYRPRPSRFHEVLKHNWNRQQQNKWQNQDFQVTTNPQMRPKLGVVKFLYRCCIHVLVKFEGRSRGDVIFFMLIIERATLTHFIWNYLMWYFQLESMASPHVGHTNRKLSKSYQLRQ